MSQSRAKFLIFKISQLILFFFSYFASISQLYFDRPLFNDYSQCKCWTILRLTQSEEKKKKRKTEKYNIQEWTRQMSSIDNWNGHTKRSISEQSIDSLHTEWIGRGYSQHTITLVADAFGLSVRSMCQYGCKCMSMYVDCIQVLCCSARAWD